MDLSISGLASGMDWKSMVSQLADVARAPEKKMQAEQSTLRQQNNAYGSIQTQLSTLTSKIKALNDSTMFQGTQAQVSDATVMSAKSSAGTPTGTYAFNITQLATAATQVGTLDTGAALSTTDQVGAVILGTAGFATPITAGSFSVNGQKITVATTDTLQAVFDQISTATGGSVVATYDPTADKISFASSSQIVLGSSTDSSNFLQATNLYNNGTGSVTSSNTLGGINQTASLVSGNFATLMSDGGSGAGAFTINGVSISYSATGDSLADVLKRINNSSAGVVASYDTVNDRMVLTDKSTGDVGISLQDVTGNFLSASGLTGGALQRGTDLLYSINGGGQLVSHSNTITQDSSGLTGLAATALTRGTSTVTIASDTTALKTAITDFVTEFNSLQAVIDANTASTTDASGKVSAGILTGTGDATDIGQTLRRLAYARNTSSSSLVKSLDDLGISTSGNDNNLIVDDTKLTAALTNNLSAIQDLFTNSTTGVAVTLSSYLDKTIGDNGTLIAKQSNVTKQIADIDTQIATMERQVTTDSASMTAEFVAMETAQAASKQQMQYLNQTFGSSSSSSSSSSSK